MISIVVSSYKEDFFFKFQESVRQTIGRLPYEIIRVHNPGLMGICQAYNEGARKANFPYLVFAHEDIIFHSDNWGEILKKVFEQELEVGLIGCAGGCYKSYLQTGWAVNSESLMSSYMIGTHYGSSHLTKIYKGIKRSIKLNKEKDIPEDFRETDIVNEEVLMLDGMFLATKKCIYEKLPFDQNTFRGFHCYDLDYSFQMSNLNHKLVVNHNILVEHFSPGVFDKIWLEEMTKFNSKWKNILPYTLHLYSDLQNREVEYNCFRNILKIHKQNNLPLINAFIPLFQIRYIIKLRFDNWLLLISKIVNKLMILSYYNFANKLSRRDK
jgi:glycosyltransferase involved in cell wall biosynthesis